MANVRSSKTGFVRVSYLYELYSKQCQTSSPVTVIKFGKLICDAFQKVIRTKKYHPQGSFYAYVGIKLLKDDEKENHLSFSEVQNICLKYNCKCYQASEEWLISHSDSRQIVINSLDFSFKVFCKNIVVDIPHLPESVTNRTSLNIIFSKLDSIKPCSGFSVTIANSKKMKCQSSECQGFITTQDSDQCKMCAKEGKRANMPESASKMKVLTKVKTGVLLEHSYAKPVTYQETPVDDPGDDIEEDEVGSEGEIMSDSEGEGEQQDPTYMPHTSIIPPNSKSKKAEDVVDVLLEDVPTEKAPGLKSLLMSQVMNIKEVEKRKRRWSTE